MMQLFLNLPLVVGFSFLSIVVSGAGDALATEELARSILEEADHDFSGKISKHELLMLVRDDNAGEDLTVAMIRSEATTHIEEEFAKCDADGDDELDEVELAKIISSYQDVRNSRVNGIAQVMIRDGDTDKDGLMTKDEIREFIISDFEKSDKDVRSVSYKDAALAFLGSHFYVDDVDKDGKLNEKELASQIRAFEDSNRDRAEL
eukprot:TRINITY_DN29469_c0_g1_i1.p1 TRINITY_DN29469_c0_g1~~TRINITY_DN29469_c0_g1_i1.p1  ORF type:complete len:205 (+),score=35.15 TRINITY_DN29469_c0_g1_i1:75-689(+)